MDEYFKKELQKLQSEDSLRLLKANSSGIDFYSNDYLGLAKSKYIFEKSNEILAGLSLKNINGSTGSRLLSGHTAYIESLEKKISTFHESEDCLIMNSGYNTNLSVFGCFAKRADTIIYDEFIHASIRDGITLSRANNFSFKHNDLSDLERKIKRAKGNLFIAVESVYSMDGDLADLISIQNLCDKHGAHLIVDEAHAVGLYGSHGQGLVYAADIQDKVLARIVTFGKALGVHGAAVLGSQNMKNYLVNKARAFIFTTSITPHTLCSIDAVYEELPNMQGAREKLRQNIDQYETLAKQILQLTNIPKTQIKTLMMPDGRDVNTILKIKQMANSLVSDGFTVRPILYPTVAKGSERLRITLHSYNTDKEIKSLINSISKLQKELQ